MLLIHIILILLLCNMHGDSNLTTSIACPPGRGGVACIVCAAGTYKSTWGFDACSVCGTGTASAIVGATSIEACIQCTPGTYTVDHVNCVPCPDNTESPAGASSVLECLAKAGYYATPGMAGIICPSGMYCPATIMRPIPCAQDTFSTEGSAECVQHIVEDTSYTLHIIILVTWLSCLGVACICVCFIKTPIWQRDDASVTKFINIRI
jgi:hypothetical protein